MNGGARDFIAFGLRIRSAFDIPGAIAVSDEAPVDLTIATGNVPAAGLATDFPYTLVEDGFVFAAPDVARYQYHANERRIVVDPLPSSDPEMVGALLIATMLPATIWAQGGFVLHAAAAIPPGGTHAVAIAGPAGSGKSTLLERMIAAGWTVLGEDSLALEVQGDAVLASGLPGILWLCDTPDRNVRRALPIPPRQQTARAPLAAILHITTASTGDETVIVPLLLPQAIETILGNRHRPGLAWLMRIDAGALPAVATFCGRLAIARLTCGNPARIALQHLAALASSVEGRPEMGTGE